MSVQSKKSLSLKENVWLTYDAFKQYENVNYFATSLVLAFLTEMNAICKTHSVHRKQLMYICREWYKRNLPEEFKDSTQLLGYLTARTTTAITRLIEANRVIKYSVNTGDGAVKYYLFINTAEPVFKKLNENYDLDNFPKFGEFNPDCCDDPSLKSEPENTQQYEVKEPTSNQPSWQFNGELETTELLRRAIVMDFARKLEKINDIPRLATIAKRVVEIQQDLGEQ